MAGLYIHIPFCHHKCIYCDFYSIAQSFDKTRYVQALTKEIEHRKAFLEEPLQTIYFGGGTPSTLSFDLLERIFVSISQNLVLISQNEVSFEANPEDISLDYVKGLKELGINRISLGVQSFEDKDLKLLNRSHNADMAKKAIETIQKAGISNISIDLISNLPNTTLESWQKNLETFLEFKLPHISCYTLMREEGTMLDKLLIKKKLSLLTEEESLQQLDLTMQILEQNGYEHYETSSFAQPNYQSRHNKAYWTFASYLGIGAGAHSYKEGLRTWNENDVFAYTNRIFAGDFDNTNRQEQLSQKDKYNEYVMLSARMKNGLSLEYVKSNFADYHDYFCKQIDKAKQQGFLNNDLSLTNKAWHLQDELILSLAL